MAVVLVTDSTFEQEVMLSELPVLIDLFAEWCGPCKMIAPIVEELSVELADRVKVVKVDIDHNPLIAQSFRVQSVPMLVVVHQGAVVAHQLGAADKRTLLKMLQPFLPTGASELKASELAALLEEKRAVAVDVRDAGSFGRYHIPGAIHIAADELVERAAELRPTDGRLRVLYERSGDEAPDLASKIVAQGIEIGFLEGGFLAWEVEGLEVERG